MQGIMIVDKPAGWTSFDVIAKLRGAGHPQTGAQRHAGPDGNRRAAGVFGGASKAVDLQLDHTKTYQAVLRLGSRTDTGDITGTVLESRPCHRRSSSCWRSCPGSSARRCRCRPCTRRSRSTDSRFISWLVRGGGGA